MYMIRYSKCIPSNASGGPAGGNIVEIEGVSQCLAYPFAKVQLSAREDARLTNLRLISARMPPPLGHW